MELRNSFLMDDLRGALATGMICPTDRQMLSLRYLPDECGQPFEALRTKASEALDHTNSILRLWLERGKRANRFTEEYVKISRKIEKMVTTMGRGLITLHMQGEDLSKAPVSIEDLLDIASFHFNKSCNGAKAAAESNPKVFERLMINQLRWLNMLLRLERTRDKLNEKVIPGKMVPVTGGKSEQLPSAGAAFKQLEGVAPVNSLGAVKAMKPLVKFETLKNSDEKNDKGKAVKAGAEKENTLKKY